LIRQQDEARRINENKRYLTLDEYQLNKTNKAPTTAIGRKRNQKFLLFNRL
jgi:hypothetical protein